MLTGKKVSHNEHTNGHLKVIYDGLNIYKYTHILSYRHSNVDLWPIGSFCICSPLYNEIKRKQSTDDTSKEKSN